MLFLPSLSCDFSTEPPPGRSHLDAAYPRQRGSARSLAPRPGSVPIPVPDRADSSRESATPLETNLLSGEINEHGAPAAHGPAPRSRGCRGGQRSPRTQWPGRCPPERTLRVRRGARGQPRRRPGPALPCPGHAAPSSPAEKHPRRPPRGRLPAGPPRALLPLSPGAASEGSRGGGGSRAPSSAVCGCSRAAPPPDRGGRGRRRGRHQRCRPPARPRPGQAEAPRPPGPGPGRPLRPRLCGAERDGASPPRRGSYTGSRPGSPPWPGSSAPPPAPRRGPAAPARPSPALRRDAAGGAACPARPAPARRREAAACGRAGGALG